MNGTRIAAVHGLILTMIRAHGGIGVAASLFGAPDLLRIDEGTWNSACEIEAIMHTSGQFVVSAQNEQFWSGASRIAFYAKLLAMLNTSDDRGVRMIDLPVTKEKGVTRTIKPYQKMSEIGQKCWERAKDEAQRRVDKNPFSDREKCALMCDLRLLPHADKYLPNQIQALVKNFNDRFHDYEKKHVAYTNLLQPVIEVLNATRTDEEKEEEKEDEMNDDILAAIGYVVNPAVAVAAAEMGGSGSGGTRVVTQESSLARSQQVLHRLVKDSRSIDWHVENAETGSGCNLKSKYKKLPLCLYWLLDVVPY